MGAVPLRVGPPATRKLKEEDLTLLREAIRRESKVLITYKSKTGYQTERVVWPFTIGYFGEGRILVGWCEKQEGYRHLRTDQIIATIVLSEHYPRRREILFKEWRAAQLEKLKIPDST